MKVLILGSGGREHAIAWKLRKDDASLELVAAPGNPGIGTLARCVPLNPSDPAAVLGLATAERPDLIVIGPEAPLAAGVSDVCRAAGFAVFGPSRAAAQIEASKRFAKEVMLRAGVPTAAATWHTNAASARRAIAELGAPVVIKASGLAAGKGVVVAESIAEAEHTVDQMLGGKYGEAGSEILVEECMHGEELSVFAITDGEHAVILPAAQDHKRLNDGDTGPNTGGMGAYAPASIASPTLLAVVRARIIGPTLLALRESGAPFTGVLYAGLMLTSDGPKVIEFNCRFGDPETQAVLPVLEQPLLPLLLGAARPDGLVNRDSSVGSACFAVATVVASQGYPAAPAVGLPVMLPADTSTMIVFHSGTANADGVLQSSGGRVVSVTGIGGSIEAAYHESFRGAEAVRLQGGHFRRDIAWRELQRHARTS